MNYIACIHILHPFTAIFLKNSVLAPSKCDFQNEPSLHRNFLAEITIQYSSILFQKHLWCKKARPRKCKLLNDLKVWNHCEAKKRKKVTNQANSKLWCIRTYLTCFARWSSTQPCWYIFSSWPHSDFTPLSRSVTWPHFFFYSRDIFGIGYRIFFETPQATKIHLCWYKLLIQSGLSIQVPFKTCINMFCIT